MNVSNKTLSILLLAAIVVSLGGTFISLNRLNDDLGSSGTGYSVASGSVNLSINGSVKIVTTDNAFADFGNCFLSEGWEGFVVNTNGTLTGGVDGSCDGSPEPIAVRNEGNVNTTVEIKVDKIGMDQVGTNNTFLSNGATSNSSLQYLVVNDGFPATGNLGGCVGATPAIFTDFSSAGVDSEICPSLTPGAEGSGQNSLLVHFQIGIPDRASGTDTVTVTFTGSEA